MVKPASRPYSRYSRDAAALLGQLIRRGRIERKLTAEDVAQRTGISRGLLRRIERGDPGCSIGSVFEAAAVTGVKLFDADRSAIAATMSANAATLTLLPKSVRVSTKAVKDDF
ncbi:MAG: helix-turn-helix transcriptional regulator [Rhodoplanes sp.]|uniref:helix-turn-helix transcriptional regulator n=1 Tax=Rhodoplanes sp. TaxID=1968906 RepID=UPI0017A0E375|nr:helix-turn-helix transcriptional regulator [Rhodoplanes sp.]NVO14445.1 helix-turn-helix transcriptional regulator [Rhodoplanes sp.]